MEKCKWQTSSAQNAQLVESESGSGPHAQQCVSERSSDVGAAVLRLSEKDRETITRRLREMGLSDEEIEPLVAAIEMPAPRPSYLLRIHRSVLAFAHALIDQTPADDGSAAPLLESVGVKRGSIKRLR